MPIDDDIQEIADAIEEIRSTLRDIATQNRAATAAIAEIAPRVQELQEALQDLLSDTKPAPIIEVRELIKGLRKAIKAYEDSSPKKSVKVE